MSPAILPRTWDSIDAKAGLWIGWWSMVMPNNRQSDAAWGTTDTHTAKS
ncbi:MAG: hypothetical protein C5S41_01245 [Candidatus Methanomarinus sp.]|nr:MAG: hypothetical protein C5S41_01245 [ANME-2 cluster archaeon]